jgi:DNA-binding NarL/FixJ family response regulator
MAQTLFYREYLKPQGLGEAVGIVLVKSATRCVVFSVILTGALGEIEEKALERVRLLIPHVQRAACAGRPVDPPRVAAESRKTVPNPLTFPELVARHFRLTPTELAVLFWIVEVGAMAEVAKILSLELRHVQARLASTLVKTGTKDEADLIRFVAHLANPVAQ